MSDRVVTTDRTPDNGVVPMSHSNNDGKPLGEDEEGRPLIKENTHRSSTHLDNRTGTAKQGIRRCSL